jgi:hypothetical protein
MKKQLALIITLITAIGTNAFAQGYVIFLTAKNNAYDEFTTPGSGVVAPGTVTATFLWAATGTADPLGAGVATTGVSSISGGWSTVASMLSSGWNVATNNFPSAQIDVADNDGGVQAGAFNYNGGSSFQLANTVGGSTYEFVVIGWDNQGGESTLEEAMADNVAMGWSGSFDYTTGEPKGVAIDTFAQAGETSFGIAPVPEPATLALAGLGGLSLLFLRRKASFHE